MARAVATLAAAAIAAAAAPFTATIDISRPGRRYDGIGALSGGGGVTRLLIDYDPALQQRIYDALFLPRAGAALQIIKVEIGGDSQSTEGTEQSHEHFRGDLNCSRGYEWAVLEAAKARNPDIRTCEPRLLHTVPAAHPARVVTPDAAKAGSAPRGPTRSSTR